MPSVAGYALSERDVKLIQEFLYTYNRQQRYVNAFGRGPDDKIDHEEATRAGVYISRSPSGGIPALQSMGSTGIGDIPGSAVCTVFKTSQSVDTTEDVTGYQHTIYNLAQTAIPANAWMIVVEDRYGKWYGFPVDTDQEPEGETETGPGWTAGLSNEDCLLLTVEQAIGVCSTIPAQETLLISDDAITWEGLDQFVYSGGTGLVTFTRTTGHSLPTLKIGSETLIWDRAGIDVDGNNWIEYKGGTTLCSDIPGTGSGTGGARGACGSNTFTVRLTCTPCTVSSNNCDGDYFELGRWYNATLVDDGFNCQWDGFFSTAYVVPANYKITFASITGTKGNQVSFRTRASNIEGILCPESGNFTSGSVGVGCHAFDQGGQTPGTHQFAVVHLNYAVGGGNAQVLFKLESGTC